MATLYPILSLLFMTIGFSASANGSNERPPATLLPAAEQLQSLAERGEARHYSGEALMRIAMPVGGIAAGQLYFNGDGSLGLWDIMNVRSFGDNPLLRKFADPGRMLQQGFAVRLRDAAGTVKTFPLTLKDFPETTFTAEYPAGIVRYKGDGKPPLDITLEGIAPFVPLDAAASGIPATFLRLTVKNNGSEEVSGDVLGWLENGVAIHSGRSEEGLRTASVRKLTGALAIDFSALPAAESQSSTVRSPTLLADFETTDYMGWKATGAAFGSSPTALSALKVTPENATGSACASSFQGGPESLGVLESPEFPIDRDILRFKAAYGNDGENLKVELLVEGKAVRSAKGSGNKRFKSVQWDLRDLQGKAGRLVVTDNSTKEGILLDQVELTDANLGPLKSRADFGTMAFLLLKPPADASAQPSVGGDLRAGATPTLAPAEIPLGESQVGAITAPFVLKPGESRAFTFAVAWHFPNLELVDWGKLQGSGRWYASRFSSAAAVADKLAADGLNLVRLTDLWRTTWYDSTLPRWALDRTIANLSTLATSTCYRFGDGRFYGFEGVHAFIGTCNHVWHYDEGAGRLFPELEMSLRTQADFAPGVGIKSDGSIPMRIDGQPGSFDPLPKQPVLFGPGYQHWASIDGQCGIILRSYRGHLTSSNHDFVKKYWPQIKLATQWLFAQDSDGDNLPDRVTHHTLDEDIAGPSPWISSLWLAAVTASGKMAGIAGDDEFAKECRERVAKGQIAFVEKLWNGERFIHLSPEAEKWRPGSYDGSHIDQVLGQQWAWRVGLGRILPAKETKAALASIFQHNYFEDLGPYYSQPENKPSRPFSVAGNAGTLMATFPEGSYRPDGKMPGRIWNSGNLFHQGFYNETMSGFEHAFASHLIYEGMVAEGLVVARAVHDRHQPESPKKGNPFNEPEAGNHYSRAMASYAVFLALCGFDYDGPAGKIGFAPRITPDDFKAAFTAAEGWGSFKRRLDGGLHKAEIAVKVGKLRLRSISLATDAKPRSAIVEANGVNLAADLSYADGTSTLILAEELTLQAGQTLHVYIKADEAR